MKSFKRGEKGFTLVELLIVVAILGVLAAVVIPNVVGLMGRGGKQAYQTDSEVIQLASSTFYSDVHGGFISNANPANVLWGCDVPATADDAGHYYPTALGSVGAHYVKASTDTFDKDSVSSALLLDSTGAAIADTDVLASAIWMGLLIQAPGDVVGPAGLQTRGNVSVLGTDTGLYLQKMPKSAMTGDTRNGAPTPGGGYCWLVGKNGTVYGAYRVVIADPANAAVGPDGITIVDITSYLGGRTYAWFAGFSGAYP